MKAVIEQFDSQAGFSATGGAAVVRENEHAELIAGLGVERSLMLSFAASGDSVGKTLATPVDVSFADYAVVSLWSQRGTRRYRSTGDFLYRITLGAGASFLVPTFSTLAQVQLDVSGLSEVTEVTVEYLGSEDDFLVLSHMVAVRDELPRDIFESVVEHLDAVRDELYPQGELAGTVTGSAGDEKVRVDGLREFVERYSVVTISDGVNAETHLLVAEDEYSFALSGLYDGPVLLHDYAGAEVRVVLVAEFGQLEKEVVLPSMTVWGFDATPIMRGNPTDQALQSYDGTDFFYRQQGKLVEWPVAVSCMARQYELIQKMGDVVRRVMARRRLWVNGQPLDVYFDEAASEILPEEAVTEVYHVQFTFRIEVREETWQRRSYPPTLAQNETVTANRE